MREVLTTAGYAICPDSDQPGLWVWFAPTDGCDSSFHTQEAATQAAWSDAVGQVMAINNLSSEQWDALSFAQQKTQMLDALTECGDDATREAPTDSKSN